MKHRLSFSLALIAVSAAQADPSDPPPGTELLDFGYCYDDQGYYDYGMSQPYVGSISSVSECHALCQSAGDTSGLLGFSWSAESAHCVCKYDDGTLPVELPFCGVFFFCNHHGTGEGPLEETNTDTANRYDAYVCYRYLQNTESTGDPHFRTWKNEHFEFHGQCDLVMTKVKDFSGESGMDLEIHLRTSMVRYWSYIKNAAIRIGNDVLEVQGSVDGKPQYWINYEYQGDLETMGNGLFPVTQHEVGHFINKREYTIDLSSKFPGQRILITTFKEFVGVKIIGANENAFGTAVGITGNFKSGKTLARDGETELDDFSELGLEWQVLPSDGKLFREMARPQFPEQCYLPEDPRGDRKRRLDESNITEEAAEAACAGFQDEFDRKGCIYDILATQDLDMVGAY